MKKLLFVIPALFLLNACGAQQNQECINSCVSVLSNICDLDITETCSNLCEEDEGIRNCVMGAVICEDLDEKITTCFSKPEVTEVAVDEIETTNEPTCDSVCNKYSDCAAFADDATNEDLEEAYN